MFTIAVKNKSKWLIACCPILKCITLVSVRSSHLPFKLIRLVSVRLSLPCINVGVRIELQKTRLIIITLSLSVKKSVYVDSKILGLAASIAIFAIYKYVDSLWI